MIRGHLHVLPIILVKEWSTDTSGCPIPGGVLPTTTEVLKVRLDGALGSLSWWGATSPQQGLGLGDCQVPSDPITL